MSAKPRRPALSRRQLSEALSELDQGVYNHESWHNELNTTLICRLKPDERDIGANPHRKCRFGQWYYSRRSGPFRDHPGFVALESAHKHMHQLAANLLRETMGAAAIALADYEQFTNAIRKVKLELASLKHGIEEAIYDLDPLTEASGRIAMLTRLREQQELVKRGVQSCALAMMDLDHFKKVNDKYGHGHGDKVLIAFVRHVMARTRLYDKLYRYGGEEFVLCAPNADEKVAYDLVDRLRQGFAEVPFGEGGGDKFNVTVSCGIAFLDPDIPVEQAIDRADKALYAAKSDGRNRTVIWRPEMG